MKQNTPFHPTGTLIANRYEAVQGPLAKPSLAGGMGVVYLHKAIEFLEQRLSIAREICDASGAATASFNLALALRDETQYGEALRYAEFAAQMWDQMGHQEYAQKARQLVEEIRGKIG